MKKFFFYFDEILKAETSEERAKIFYNADLDYQRDNLKYQELERLLKLVNKLDE